MSGQPTLGRRLAQAAITAIAAVCFVGGPLLPASASGLDGLLPGGNAYWYERANAIAARYNLGSVFVRQMNQESGFADEVIYGRQVSWAGAEGIAQIMRSYHPGVDPLDPEAALDYAARHMLDLLTYFNGDITKALAAYDAGAGAVLDSQAQGGENWLALLPPETQQYVAAIMLPGEPHILTNWAALKQWWERTSEPVHFKRFDERMAASGSLRHRRPRSSSPRLDASRESLQVGRGPRRRLYRPPVAPRHRHQPRPGPRRHPPRGMSPELGPLAEAEPSVVTLRQPKIASAGAADSDKLRRILRKEGPFRMDARTTLRQQMQTLHGIMEAAIRDCPSDAVARKFPDSTVNSIGAIYAHTIFGEDGLLNGLIRGEKPVYYSGGWADKIGLDMPRGGLEPDWAPSLDIGLFREYAKAVYEATDSFLANASDSEFEKVVDAGFAPPMPVQSFVANILAWHVATHQGEISALKGVQGLNGLVLTH